MSAFAASVLLGVLVPRLVTHDSGPSLISVGSHGLVAGRELAAALATQLAVEQTPDATVRIGLSFENTSGQLCRTFSMSQRRTLSGLACFSDGKWQVGMVVEDGDDPRPGAPTAAVRMAASTWPAALMHEVQNHIRGEPLDADAERAAKARGWRP